MRRQSLVGLAALVLLVGCPAARSMGEEPTITIDVPDNSYAEVKPASGYERVSVQKSTEVRLQVRAPLVQIPSAWKKVRLVGYAGKAGGVLGADLLKGDTPVVEQIRRQMDDRKLSLRYRATGAQRLVAADGDTEDLKKRAGDARICLLAFGDVEYNGRLARAIAKEPPTFELPDNDEVPSCVKLLANNVPHALGFDANKENIRSYARFVFEVFEVTPASEDDAAIVKPQRMVEVTAVWLVRLCIDPTNPPTDLPLVSIKAWRPSADGSDKPAASGGAIPTFQTSFFGASLGSSIAAVPDDSPDLKFVGGVSVQDNYQGALVGLNASLRQDPHARWRDWNRLGIMAGRSVGGNEGGAYVIAPSYRVGENAWPYIGFAFGKGNGRTRTSLAFGITYSVHALLGSAVTGGGAESTTMARVQVNQGTVQAVAEPPVKEGYAAVHFLVSKIGEEPALQQAGLSPEDRVCYEWPEKHDGAFTGAFVEMELENTQAGTDPKKPEHRSRRLWSDYSRPLGCDRAEWWDAHVPFLECVTFEPDKRITAIRIVTQRCDRSGKPIESTDGQRKVLYVWPAAKEPADHTATLVDVRLNDSTAPHQADFIALKKGDALRITVSLP